MASTTANVNITTDQGVFVLVAKVDRARLIYFSDLAAAQLTSGGPLDRRIPKGAVTLARGAAEGAAAARVAAWMEANDTSDPTQLTLAGLHLEHFDEIVYTYATAYAFRLKRELRGDDLRNAIYDYMHQGNLRHDEFAMIVEWLAFDGGLVKTAIHEAMFRCCKGDRYVPPDMAKIKAYAKRVGLWEEMSQVRQEIKAKMDEKDRHDEKGAVARLARAVVG
ncbi:hypothetical protein LTR53_000648 [Teratosphaeriaceae sp. CCFEE 6253]|nr:hypothetical protein LTR53_000648 [Teratosphaeriaceae sp. CCFEE 6253]